MIQFIVLTLIWIGMLGGYLEVETEGEIIPDFNKVYQDYEDDKDFFIPEYLMKGLLFVMSKFMFVGHTLALWVYPYGLVIAIVLAIVSIVNVQWFIYPFLFVYVLRQERQIEKQEIKQK